LVGCHEGEEGERKVVVIGRKRRRSTVCYLGCRDVFVEFLSSNLIVLK